MSLKLTRFQWFVAGLVGALSFGAFAVTGGGFPSRPTFQLATISGSTAGSTLLQQCNTSNSSGARCWSQRVGSTGAMTWSTTNDSGTIQASPLGLGRDTSGNFTGAVISAPTSGAALTVTGTALAANPAIFVNGTAGASVIEVNSGLAYALNSSGTNFGMIQNDVADHWCLASGASLATLGTNILCWDKLGNITAPSSGTVPWPVQTNGSFTSTLATGCTTTPTATVNWVKNGTLVTLWVNSTTNFNCTSNSATHETDATLPASIRPSSDRCAGIVAGEDATAIVTWGLQVRSTGTWRVGRLNSGTGGSSCGGPNATASGTFALDSFTVTYATN